MQRKKLDFMFLRAYRRNGKKRDVIIDSSALSKMDETWKKNLSFCKCTQKIGSAHQVIEFCGKLSTIHHAKIFADRRRSQQFSFTTGWLSGMNPYAA